MQTTRPKPRRQQTNVILPRHVDALVRLEADQRKVRIGKVLAERLAASYGVEVEVTFKPAK